jgi:hypothetical protein
MWLYRKFPFLKKIPPHTTEEERVRKREKEKGGKTESQKEKCRAEALMETNFGREKEGGEKYPLR